jgi:hypothetical protein
VRRKVHHGINAMLAQERQHDITVTGVAHHERTIEHRLAKPGDQIVENDDPFAAGAQLQCDVTADVASAASD